MSFEQHFLSGALSGFTSVLCLQPFDLLKTRLQQNDGTRGAQNQLITIVRSIVRANGPFGLWRGTAPTLMRNVPGIALYLSGLQRLRSIMATSPYFHKSTATFSNSSTLPKLTTQGNLVSGAIARVAVGVVLNPISVIKARYESDIHSYTSLRQALTSLISSGPRELFRGAGASALRDAPYSGLFLAVYEQVKQDLDEPFKAASLHASALHVTSGAIAGTLATFMTHPFDVLKTKIQVRPESRYNSLQSAALSIYAQRGPAGFFDGASLRLTRKVFSSAIGWAVYEGVLLFMQRDMLKAL